MRYHHQFQQLLQWQLQRQWTPEAIAALHDRASQWFEDEGLLDEALEHAVRIGNFDRAARLIEKHRVEMLNDDRWYVLERWLERLPDSIRRQRPDLLLVEAWSAYERFQFDRLASALERIDSLLDGEAPDPSVSGEYLLLRGELHYWAGEGEAARRYFESARKELPERHGLVRGLLELQYGLALCMDGEKERALEVLSELAQEVGTPEGIYLSRLVAGLYFIHQLSASPFPARIEATRLRVVAQRSNIVYTEAWSSYMEACTHLHANEPGQAQTHFSDAVRRRYILHSRAAVDALAGLALTQQLLQQEDTGDRDPRDSAELRPRIEPRAVPGRRPLLPRPAGPAASGCRLGVRVGTVRRGGLGTGGALHVVGSPGHYPGEGADCRGIRS